MQEINETIEKLKPLFAQREAIDQQIAEVLQSTPGKSIPATTREKRSYNKKTAATPIKQRKGDFTPAEQTNIIALYNRGELTGSIARLMKVPPTKMYSYIFSLKKKGLVADRVPVAKEETFN